MTKIEMMIAEIQENIESKKRSLKVVCDSLAHDFKREGGPRWDSCGYETEWRTIRTEIRTLQPVLASLKTISEMEGA